MSDPVVVTKYINKMRIFYLLKMVVMKEKYEGTINKQQEDLEAYKGLHGELVSNKREENAVKRELVAMHNVLKE